MARTTFDGKVADIYSSALDPTNQKQAVTQQDVLDQDFATRLWQKEKFLYDNQAKKSDESYDLSIGATGRSALQRGMGRSSYTTQTMANLEKQKNDARNDIYSALIADYQGRLSEQENADRQLAASYLNAIISAGGTPSDDLLRRAGISRADAMAMIQQPKSSGGGGGTPKPSGLESDGTETPEGMSDDDFMKFMNGFVGNIGADMTGMMSRDKNTMMSALPAAKGTSSVANMFSQRNQGTSAAQTQSTAPMDPSQKWFTGRDQYQDSTVLNPHNRREKRYLP